MSFENFTNLDDVEDKKYGIEDQESLIGVLRNLQENNLNLESDFRSAQFDLNDYLDNISSEYPSVIKDHQEIANEVLEEKGEIKMLRKRSDEFFTGMVKDLLGEDNEILISKIKGSHLLRVVMFNEVSGESISLGRIGLNGEKNTVGIRDIMSSIINKHAEKKDFGKHFSEEKKYDAIKELNSKYLSLWEEGSDVLDDKLSEARIVDSIQTLMNSISQQKNGFVEKIDGSNSWEITVVGDNKFEGTIEYEKSQIIFDLGNSVISYDLNLVDEESMSGYINLVKNQISTIINGVSDDAEYSIDNNKMTSDVMNKLSVNGYLINGQNTGMLGYDGYIDITKKISYKDKSINEKLGSFKIQDGELRYKTKEMARGVQYQNVYQVYGNIDDLINHLNTLHDEPIRNVMKVPPQEVE